MPQALPFIAAIGGAAAVVGTVGQYRQGRKAQQAQEKQQEVSSRRERMQAIRQSQIQRASATMSAIGAGTGMSSGVEGGIGALSSQLGTELGYGQQMTDLSHQISRASGKQAMWGGISNLGMTAFNASGGFGAFGGSKQPSPFQGYQEQGGFMSPRPPRNPIYG